MVGKRKGEDLREKIAKMARAAESNNQLDYKKARSEVPNLSLPKVNITVVLTAKRVTKKAKK